MKKLNIKIYSKYPNSKMGEFVKRVYRESGLYVENIADIQDFISSKSYTDCLILDYSMQESYDFDFSQLFADIHALYIDGYVFRIYIICDKEWLVSESFTLCLTMDVGKEYLINIVDEIATKINMTSVETMTRTRNIVMNNLCSDGFSTRHNGTIMLVDAIIRAIVNKKMIINLRKDVYPYLMHKYNVSNSCIELSIAKAITSAYSKSTCNKFHAIPTNKELLTYKICELYDYLSE